jgi:prepilin-type N-terminal cleavage/methylation domain-containing protein
MKKAGFTLIELIVFIVIISIAASILFPILVSLRFSGTLPDQTVAQQVARSRMELILERRYITGFTGLTDPCSDASPPAACVPPTDYAVSATITDNWGGDVNYKVITVQVTGKAQTTLTDLVAAYD